MSETRPNQESEQDKKEPQEMTDEAREVIRLFQEAKLATDIEEQNKLLQNFYAGLMNIVTPEGERPNGQSDQELKRVVIDGKKLGGYNYLSVGGGTSGQRIYFKNHIIVPSGESPAIYGYDITPEEFQGQYELESKDRKPRWMTYYKPEGSDWSHGQPYWERFVKNFGNEIIDLVQNTDKK